MRIQNVGPITVCLFDNLIQEGRIKHFVTTRTSSTALPHRHQFNLSFNTGDPAPQVLENRRSLSEAMVIPLDRITTGKQVHGQDVKVLSPRDVGRGGRDYDTALEATDALVTNLQGICPMVLVADCVPILLYDPNTRAIATIHAGWKGTLASIAEQTVRTMKMHFASNPSDIIAGIGPSIGPCCFHVGPEVISRARKAFGPTTACIASTSARGGYLDLWKANQDQLCHAGLRKARIEVAGICTAHQQHMFFSHRGEKGRAGRFAAGIYMETR